MNDFKHALRVLCKNPGFTTVAVLTLTLGIGATTIVFSIVNGVLLQPLEYPESDRIVHVWEADPEKGFYYNRSSPANFVDWRRNNQVFEAIGFAAHHSGWATLSFIYAGEGDAAERLRGRFVSADYFKVFRQEPLLGRTFLPEEELAGSQRVTVISHRLWMRLFQGDRDIIGKTISLENRGRHRYEIIGVMPEGFHYLNADVWVSCAHMPRPMTRRGGHMIAVVARLKDGVSLEEAQTEMTAIQSRIHAEYGHLEENAPQLAMGREINLQPLLESVVYGIRPSLLMFSGAVALVLLIACANVANLLLSRGLARRREMSTRAALGAGRWRLVRQLLSESVVLFLVGGIGGTLLAWAGTKLLVQFSAGTIPRLESVGIDWRVFGFALGASLVTGVLSGLAPAWQSSKANLNDALKEGTGRVTGGRVQHGLRGAFTVTQVTLALILLIGAGLLIRSFERLQSVEPGFDAEKLLTVEFALTGAAYETMVQRRAFLNQLADVMRHTPGVEAASTVSMIPDRRAWPYPFARSDQAASPPSEWSKAGVRIVSPDFLKTFGMPLLRGREFLHTDTAESEPVAMVNQTFVRQVFPDEDPLDQRITCSGNTWRIVGVFADVKNHGLAGETGPEICVPCNQWHFTSAFLTLRAHSHPMALAPIVTEHVHMLNPGQPLNTFRTMQGYLDNSTKVPRFRSMLLGSFALAALLLASVGIYGVMAYSVTQRTNEMGVRMALGAQKTDLLGLILRQGLNLTLIGVAVGLAGSFALTRSLKAHLFEIESTDLATFIGVSFLLTLVSLAACLTPAWRATRIPPTDALRYE